MRIVLFSLAVVALGFSGCGKAVVKPERVTAESLIRVNSTNQSFDFFHPWSKKAPTYRKGLGVVVEGGNILVSAELVADHTYVELESPGSAKKSAAQVVQVDYDCDLALLKPAEADFLKGTKPLALDETARVGDHADILQLEATGAIAATPATITTIAVAPYALGHVSLLTYRLSSPLQGRDSSFTVPAVRDGRLLGIVVRYDGRSQTADLVPSPVVAHFLKDASHPPYAGVPRVGVAYSPTRDPQFRRYIGLKEPGGVYVTEVRPGSAADKAGLKKGDVILAVNHHDIDEDGNYNDPRFGPLAFSHLTSTLAHVGEAIDFDIFRDGSKQTRSVALESVDHSQVVSEPYIFDHQPKYFILGGLVFQELSEPYLEEWGGSWAKEAPQRLVALDAFQDELPPDHGKVVFLSQVFPTANTLGYEELDHLVVSKVNGVPIKSLEDLANAADSHEGGYVKIEFDDDPPVIYLDANEIKKSNEQIMEQYGIPALQNLK